MTSKVWFFAIFGTIFMPGALWAASPFSNYGVIQNVQNYSSNPFWDPNGPYNQRMPQPVYVQGPDVNTGDCQRTVDALIANECVTQNNCIDVSIGDIRPTIMVQLSRLPGHNYATACAGFIDTAFADYKSKYANAGAMRVTGFPTAAAKNTTTGNEFKFQNPYQVNAPQWAADMAARDAELKSAQATGTAAFPTTINDYSFTERMENAAAGYEPYKDKLAYVTPDWDVEKYKDYLNRKKGELADEMAISKSTLSKEDYCKKYPGDAYCNDKGQNNTKTNNTQNDIKNNTATTASAINKIPGEIVFKL